MNILVFGNARGFGGAQTAFRRFVDFLVADGHSVGVIGLAGLDDIMPGNGNVAFASRLSHPSKPVIRLAQVLRATQRARSFKPKLFVTVGLANSAGLIARFLPQGAFRVAHDFIFGRNLSDPLLKSLPRNFDALAVQAPSMVEALLGKGFNGMPLAWLPCFPDPPLPGHARSKRNSESHVRLAYFGRLAPNKGIDLLMHALASAQLSRPTTLDIWGGGDELDSLKQLSLRLGCDSGIQFRGHYPEGADFASLMCSYDGLALTSTGAEGLPLILLEAMAYGVPLLTTRVGAIPDCANADTVLVEPDVESLRTGLEQFVARTAANSFSTSRLQRHYETHFSFEVMANRWREMISNPKRFFSGHV